MIFDLQALFSDKQAVTTGTQLSTNSLDTLAGQALQSMPAHFGSPLHDPGRGNMLTVLVMVNTAFTGGTSLQVNLISSANENLSSATVLSSSAVIAEASLVSGYQFRLTAFPQGITQRYLGVQYVTVGTHSTGTITAGIVFARDSNYAPI